MKEVKLSDRHLAMALEAGDWSGVSVGGKELIAAAIDTLTAKNPDHAMNTNQTIDGVPRDPCQWTDLQILDFLGVALRNVDLVGTVKLSEIRQGFEYMRAQSGAEQPAPVAVVLPERLNHTDGLHTYEYVTGHNAAIDKMLGVKS